MKKRILGIIIAIVMVIGILPVAAITAFAASTEEIEGEEYYQISTADDLIEFAQIVNGTHESIPQNTAANAILLDDIVLNENVLNSDGSFSYGEFTQWTPIGNYSNQFSGTFDGNGKTVSGIYIDRVGFYQSLIGCNAGTVKNVTVADSYIRAEGSHIGAVVGLNYGTVVNCVNYATLYAYETDYYATGVGGVVGNNHGTVQRCANYGIVMGGKEFFSIGGVVGQMYGGSISNCYNAGTVGGEREVGGVIGKITNGASLSNSFSVGVINCDNDVGGVVGDKDNGTVTNCYYLDQTADVGIAVGDGEAVAVSEEQLASGEIAYLLNGDQSELVFGQTLTGGKKNAFPVFVTERNMVYLSTGSDGTSDIYINDSTLIDPEEIYTIYFNDGVYSTDLNIVLTNTSCEGVIEKEQNPQTKIWTVKVTFPHEEECVGTHNFTVYCSNECCCVEMVALVDGKSYACTNVPDHSAVIAWNDTNDDGIIDDDEITYTTLSDALNAGGTVKMYKSYDIGAEGTVYIYSATVTLDLNGKSITWLEAESAILSIREDAEITIKGNGSILSTMNSMGPSVAIEVYGGKLILEGGMVKSPYYAIEMYGGELIVNGGNISTEGVAIQSGICTINGGTVERVGNYDSCTINGGTVTYLNNSGDLTIKGGVFGIDPSSWLAEGYEATLNSETYYYEVSPISYEVVLGLIENGSVVSDKNEAIAGENVTMIVVPNAHYRLESLRVTDKNGVAVALDENYSFVMPVGGATVAATFKPIDYATHTDFVDVTENLDRAIEDLDAAMKQSDADLLEKITNLNTALETAKTAYESADNNNKEELLTKINEATTTLGLAIEAVQDDLDDAKNALNQAILDGDSNLDSKITALSEALETAKTAYESAENNNKEELLSKINEATATLGLAIEAVQDDLDDAKEALSKAILDGDSNLDSKITALSEALENAKAAFGALDSASNSDLSAKIEEADATLKAAVDALSKELDDVKQMLENKDKKLQTFIIIVCIVSSLAFCGCGTLAAFYIIDKKKKN